MICTLLLFPFTTQRGWNPLVWLHNDSNLPCMVTKMTVPKEPPVCKADRLVHVLGARSAVYECTSLPTQADFFQEQLHISDATFSLKKV